MKHETQTAGRLSLLDANTLKPEQKKLYDQIDQTLIRGPRGLDFRARRKTEGSSVRSIPSCTARL